MPAGPGLAAAAGGAGAIPWAGLALSITNTIGLLFGGRLSSREKTTLWQLTNYSPAINCSEGCSKYTTSKGTIGCMARFGMPESERFKKGCGVHPLQTWIPIAIIGIGILVVIKK